MPNVILDTLKDTSSLYGTFHSWWLAGSPQSGTYYSPSERIVGDIFSISHRRSPDGKYRSGGPFYSIKFRTKVFASDSQTYRSGERVAYKGRYYSTFGANQYDYSYMDMSEYDTDAINAKAFSYGAQAYEALRPDRPDFSPLVGLAELARELPGIMENFRDFNRRYHAELRRKRKLGVHMNKLGKSHLAIQFGILPIISDVKSFITAYNNANKRAKQLLRDNGKWVRRRAFLSAKPSENFVAGWTTNYTTPYHPRMYPTHVTQCYGGGNARTENSSRRYVHVWCVGKSKYFLPDDIIRNPHGFEILKRRIYSNLQISPETIYNLIPWSWFIDYFTSVGHFVAALSGGIGDQVIFKYAYVMRSELHDDKTVHTQYVYKSASSTGPVTSTVHRTGVLRSRVHASLFGFGISEDGLSSHQWGILGALGLSKL